MENQPKIFAFFRGMGKHCNITFMIWVDKDNAWHIFDGKGDTADKREIRYWLAHSTRCTPRDANVVSLYQRAKQLDMAEPLRLLEQHLFGGGGQ